MHAHRLHRLVRIVLLIILTFHDAGICIEENSHSLRAPLVCADRSLTSLTDPIENEVQNLKWRIMKLEGLEAPYSAEGLQKFADKIARLTVSHVVLGHANSLKVYNSPNIIVEDYLFIVSYISYFIHATNDELLFTIQRELIKVGAKELGSQIVDMVDKMTPENRKSFFSGIRKEIAEIKCAIDRIGQIIETLEIIRTRQTNICL